MGEGEVGRGVEEGGKRRWGGEGAIGRDERGVVGGGLGEAVRRGTKQVDGIFIGLLFSVIVGVVIIVVFVEFIFVFLINFLIIILG